jgi:hypothetical protein
VYRQIIVVVCLSLLGLASCNEDIVDRPTANRTPQTFLWLFPDSSIGVGVSRQRLRWWGEDADGTVIGYLFSATVFPTRVTSPPSPDTLRYTWVDGNDTLMAFPLDTLFREYTVVLRSVDNTCRKIADRSVVRLSPSPYIDANDNGTYDAGDVAVPELATAVDPAGVVRTFPIRNTPPTMQFARDPRDETRSLRQPDTTYTVATFAWNGADNDGNNTLASYRIALNDTNDTGAMLTVSARDTVITLAVPRSRSDAAGADVAADVYGGKFLGRQMLGTIPGLRLDAENVLYVQARDVAGEASPFIRMPSAGGHWFVKRPRGHLLLVSDYINSDSSLADATYGSALAAVPSGDYAVIDRMNIGRGLNANDKKYGLNGVMLPAFVDPALILTFLLYDHVVWYTDQYPNLGAAQLALFTYTQNGGKLIFSTTFESSIDPRGALRDFVPIDSISTVDLSPTRPPIPPAVAGDTRLPAGCRVVPESTGTNAPYPLLAFNTSPSIHSVFMRPIYRRSDARYIYHLQNDPRVPVRYIGSPNVAVVDGLGTTIFVGLPLHLMNNTSAGNPDGLSAFFTRCLTQEFRPAHRIDRRRF